MEGEAACVRTISTLPIMQLAISRFIPPMFLMFVPAPPSVVEPSKTGLVAGLAIPSFWRADAQKAAAVLHAAAAAAAACMHAVQLAATGSAWTLGARGEFGRAGDVVEPPLVRVAEHLWTIRCPYSLALSPLCSKPVHNQALDDCVHYDCARHTSYENAILMNWSSAPGSLLRSGLPRQRIEGDAAPLCFAMLVWRCAAAAHTHWYCLASAW